MLLSALFLCADEEDAGRGFDNAKKGEKQGVEDPVDEPPSSYPVMWDDGRERHDGDAN